jgi:CheY-like chemotaxis protein
MGDEDEVMQVTRKGLEMAGFEVHAKCNPLDALAGFKAGAHYMVLLDVKMRQMDDFELYEKLSRIDDRVKVCFLTGYDMDYFEKFKERFPHVPTRCFINQKPISMKNLLVGTVMTELGISQPKDNLNSSSQSAS